MIHLVFPLGKGYFPGKILKIFNFIFNVKT